MAIEQDHAAILSGVMAGMTTGAPIALQLVNRDHANWKGKAVPAYTTPRPGHADLAAAIKYGYDDIRPALERASARETAARVAVGAVLPCLSQNFRYHGGRLCLGHRRPRRLSGGHDLQRPHRVRSQFGRAMP